MRDRVVDIRRGSRSAVVDDEILRRETGRVDGDTERRGAVILHKPGQTFRRIRIDVGQSRGVVARFNQEIRACGRMFSVIGLSSGNRECALACALCGAQLRFRAISNSHQEILAGGQSHRAADQRGNRIAHAGDGSRSICAFFKAYAAMRGDCISVGHAVSSARDDNMLVNAQTFGVDSDARPAGLRHVNCGGGDGRTVIIGNRVSFCTFIICDVVKCDVAWIGRFRAGNRIGDRGIFPAR